MKLVKNIPKLIVTETNERQVLGEDLNLYACEGCPGGPCIVVRESRGDIPPMDGVCVSGYVVAHKPKMAADLAKWKRLSETKITLEGDT